MSSAEEFGATVTEEWPAIRNFHLVGGVRALSLPGRKLTLECPVLSGKTAAFSLRNYADVYGVLDAVKLELLGVDFISHVLEASGQMPPDWQPWCAARSWSCKDAANEWARIAHGARDANNAHAYDLSRRVSHQIRVCAWRLRQCSDAYRDQLLARVKSNNARHDVPFEDGFTWLVYLALQSFLVDACVLRDYLAEYAARYYFAERQMLETSRITKFAPLIKAMQTAVTVPDDAIFRDLFAAGAADTGWLAELGNYRDLVIHSAPLARAGARMMSLIDHVPLPHGEILPLIRCPIPGDPKALAAARSRGDHFADFDQLLQLFRDTYAGAVSSKDGLTYCHAALCALSALAATLAATSPIRPKDVVISESDLQGPIIVTRHAS